MEKMILFLILTTFLSAQESGKAAAAAAKPTNWQNWTFASTALATASTAVLVIAFNNGHEAQSH